MSSGNEIHHHEIDREIKQCHKWQIEYGSFDCGKLQIEGIREFTDKDLKAANDSYIHSRIDMHPGLFQIRFKIIEEKYTGQGKSCPAMMPETGDGWQVKDRATLSDEIRIGKSSDIPDDSNKPDDLKDVIVLFKEGQSNSGYQTAGTTDGFRYQIKEVVFKHRGYTDPVCHDRDQTDDSKDMKHMFDLFIGLNPSLEDNQQTAK